MNLIKKQLIFASIFALCYVLLPDVSLAATPSAATVGDNPIAKLTTGEADYYGKSFSYALEALEDDQVYDWRTESSEGQIRVGKAFKNRSGGVCRTFSEIYNIGGAEGQNVGYGCKRDGGDGWCKLRTGNMLTCAFEEPDGLLEQFAEGIHSVEKSVKFYKNPDIGNIKGPNGGSIGGATMPNGPDTSGIADSISKGAEELSEDAKPGEAIKWWSF